MYLLWMCVCAGCLHMKLKGQLWGVGSLFTPLSAALPAEHLTSHPPSTFIEFSAVSFVRLFSSAPNQLELIVKHPYLNFID